MLILPILVVCGEDGITMKIEISLQTWKENKHQI